MKTLRLWAALACAGGLFAAAPPAKASLDASDEGVYAVQRKDGTPGTVFRLSLQKNAWHVEQQRDGAWHDVTCEKACAMVESSAADVARFLGAVPEDAQADCIHDQAFAICRITPSVKSGERHYVFVALTQAKPLVLKLMAQSAHPPDRAFVNGFGGLVLVSTDEDWQAKWNTPPETKPEFHTVNKIRRGIPVFVLTFFTNPRLNADGEAEISCDIEVVKPDGTVSSTQRGMPCFKAKVANTSSTYLTGAVLRFTGDPDDPEGVWRFNVTVRDQVRQLSLPLSTTLDLLGQ